MLYTYLFFFSFKLHPITEFCIFYLCMIVKLLVISIGTILIIIFLHITGVLEYYFFVREAKMPGDLRAAIELKLTDKSYYYFL